MGFAKRLRKSLRAAAARESGRYPDGALDPLTFQRRRGSVIGAGMQREAERIERIRKANRKIKSAQERTRQQMRALDRAALKRRRAAFKRQMMDKRLPGGAAVIR